MKRVFLYNFKRFVMKKYILVENKISFLKQVFLISNYTPGFKKAVIYYYQKLSHTNPKRPYLLSLQTVFYEPF